MPAIATERSSPPALVALDAPLAAPPAGLPTPLTPLIGREREVAAVAALLLNGPRRLVTLTGPGGVGKTRLALRVAASLRDHVAGGVVFVALDDVPDPALLLPTIGRTLGLHSEAGGPIDPCWFGRVADALRDREVVIVLDGFERLVSGAAALADLLGACPAVRLLVTSRVRLRLAAEQDYPVLPLPLPPPVADGEPPDLLLSPAAALFVERARAHRPSLRLDDEAPVVAEICRRLDGLPLAIELAAARLAHLGPRTLLAHLEPRLPLLTTGARDGPARHRTMHDAIAWSVNLLTPAERALFVHLGVFAGTFTLAAAGAVGGEGAEGASGQGEDDDELLAPSPPRSLAPSVLDSLGALIDASLVRMLPEEVGGEERYVMLDTVREYAAELLAGDPEADLVRARLAAWLIDFGERAWWPLITPERGTWLARIAAEDPNVHAALAWALERGDAETALRLIAGSVYYRWNTQGLLAAEGRWLDRALDLAERRPETVDPVVHGRCLTHDGMRWFQTGDYDRARRRTEEAIAVLRRADDVPQLTTALGLLAGILTERGDYAPARELYLEVVALKRSGPPRGLINPCINLGSISTSRGLLDVGRDELDEAVALADRHGDDRDRAFARVGLGENLALGGNLDRARPLLEAARLRLHELHDVRGVALAATWLAFLERRQGARRAAADRIAEALPLVQQVGDRPVAAILLDVLAGLLVDAGRGDDAARLLGASLRVRDEMGIGVRPVDRAWRDAIGTAARAALGLGRYGTAEAAGRHLSLAESLALAADLVSNLSLEPDPKPKAPIGVAADLDPETASAIGSLSRREIDVVRLLVAGCSDREVGERLSISPHTASNHVARILGKLAVPTRAAAAALAVRAGLA